MLKKRFDLVPVIRVNNSVADPVNSREFCYDFRKALNKLQSSPTRGFGEFQDKNQGFIFTKVLGVFFGKVYDCVTLSNSCEQVCARDYPGHGGKTERRDHQACDYH